VVGTASKNSAIVMRGRALVAGLEARIRATTPDPSRDIVLGAGFGSAGTRSLGLALGYAGLIVFHASNVLKPPRPQFLKRDSLSTHWRSAVAAIEGNRTATNQIAAELVDGGNADFVATCHASCDKVDYPGLFKQYPADAVVDMPSAEYFLDLWRAFPSAQVVLITRPADSHVDSRRAICGDSLRCALRAPVDRPCGLKLEHIGRNLTATLFSLHAALVRCVVPRERLLDFDLSQKLSSDDMHRAVRAFVGPRLRAALPAGANGLWPSLSEQKGNAAQSHKAKLKRVAQWMNTKCCRRPVASGLLEDCAHFRRSRCFRRQHCEWEQRWERLQVL